MILLSLIFVFSYRIGLVDQTRYTLIQKLQNQSDEVAWSRFEEAYGDYIVAVLKRVGMTASEVEDLRQDILLKLWKKFPELEFVEGQFKFRNWLYEVIKNTAFTYLSTRTAERARVQRYFEESNSLKPTEEEKFDDLMHSEWKNYVAKVALKSLRASVSPESLEIFKKSMTGVTVKELSKEYGIKENTVYRIKNRVRDKLTLRIAQLKTELE